MDIFRKQEKSIGFVPTMGALHEGHLSLVRKAKQENDKVMVSIFVNPTQFNNPEDLKNYPRTPELDNSMLSECGVDIIFAPSETEVYNSEMKQRPVFDPGKIAEFMEGEYRPGHFAGVVQVVARLFEIMKPTRAYFGEKDFQQLAIIKHMVKELSLPVEIVACQTVREKNGLAMSSRNQKLTQAGLENASDIFKVLSFMKDNMKKISPDELEKKAKSMIESNGNLRVEYLAIADEESLQPASSWDQYKHMRAFVAAYCEGVRLIDNIKIC